MNDDLIWQVRAWIYNQLAETTRAPSVEQAASHFKLTHEQAATVFQTLHQRHALFLSPNTNHILMANPFSGIETEYKVYTNQQTYFANCAWDSFGIPAALHSDADIQAPCSASGETLYFQVRKGQINPSETVVYFLVPFKDWYTDLPYT